VLLCNLWQPAAAAVEATTAATTSPTRTRPFTTSAVPDTFVGYFSPEDGSTVGVGMPVSVVFSCPITHRAAVEKAITVSAEPHVEIVGHWYSGTRLDFRPREYWKRDTKVSLRLRLNGVEGAAGVFGSQSKDAAFVVGRAQTSVADLRAGDLTVTTTAGSPPSTPSSAVPPEHRTWAGRMVISEQLRQTRMDSTTVGLGDEYDIPDVPHAQRLTTTGTFIHGNYWSHASAFGNANTSHGCISLRDVKGAEDPGTDAAKFFRSSNIGDIVEVRHSGDTTVDPSNGLSGWNMAWADWKAGSAL
jgi:lipoprotein-anchoring transpeptidase ErfK/SrfK